MNINEKLKGIYWSNSRLVHSAVLVCQGLSLDVYSHRDGISKLDAYAALAPIFRVRGYLEIGCQWRSLTGGAPLRARNELTRHRAIMRRAWGLRAHFHWAWGERWKHDFSTCTSREQRAWRDTGCTWWQHKYHVDVGGLCSRCFYEAWVYYKIELRWTRKPIP